MEREKPKGFYATCRCGVVIGAMDFVRTERKDSGKLIADWLMWGCTVTPVFEGTWGVKVGNCTCNNSADGKKHYTEVNHDTARNL